MFPRPRFKRCSLKRLITYFHPPTKLDSLGNCATLACFRYLLVSLAHWLP
jgi:hypothetical protein